MSDRTPLGPTCFCRVACDLHAAAPELCEALRRLLAEIETTPGRLAPDHSPWPNLWRLLAEIETTPGRSDATQVTIRHARAALAKAEGKDVAGE